MNPDFHLLEQVLSRQGIPTRVPLYEHFVDDQVVEKIMGFKLDDPGLDLCESARMRWKRLIQFYLQMGYDYLPMQLPPRFKEGNDLYADDTAIHSKGRRNWINEHTGPIQTEADLDNPSFWPSVDQLIDYELFEDVGEMLPPGMAVVGGVAGGPFEHVMFKMGIEALSLAFYDKPGFVKRFVDKVGELLAGAAKRLAGLSMIGAYRFADDMGYKTATLISPGKLRELIFPWHKRIVAIAHEAGKPFVLHACGNLEQVMDDLIDEVHIDAKQANEDVIMPIEEVKRRWGDRVAILGGLDLGFLCTATPPQVAERTKRILDACAPSGGFALGTGNTVANYVPIENYLAMVNALHEWNGA